MELEVHTSDTCVEAANRLAFSALRYVLAVAAPQPDPGERLPANELEALLDADDAQLDELVAWYEETTGEPLEPDAGYSFWIASTINYLTIAVTLQRLADLLAEEGQRLLALAETLAEGSDARERLARLAAHKGAQAVSVATLNATTAAASAAS